MNMQHVIPEFMLQYWHVADYLGCILHMIRSKKKDI